MRIVWKTVKRITNEIFVVKGLRIVSKLLSVLVFCNALVTGNHQTYFLQGEGGGGNMRHAEVSQRHIFKRICP